MAFNAGYTKRPTRRVYVLRGFNGCEPETFTRTAPVASGVTVKSGNVISLDDGEWVLGAAAGKVPYIALSDDNDTDVSASGLLPALSCAGQFEIETVSYVADTYAEDDPLVAATSSNAGKLAKGALDGSADIVGFASRGGLTNLNGTPGPKREVNADTSTVLTFITKWQPKNAA
jgi:hypothetical protein